MTRALIFCEGAAQKINKENGVRNHLRKSISVIIPSSEFEADLEDNLFDYNSEYEDCEYNSDHVIYSDEGVFDKSIYEEMSCDEYPLRTNKKRRRRGINLRGKGGRKFNNSKKELSLIFLKYLYIFEFMINTAPPASNTLTGRMSH